MKISVIICTLHRSEDLKKTLATIDKQTRLPDELLIVDQSEDKKTATIAKKKRPYKVRYAHQKEKSLTAARNRGMREAKGEIFMFLDDDVSLDKKYIAAAEKTFKDTTVACVHGYTTNYFLHPKFLYFPNKLYNWLFLNDYLNPYACKIRGIFGNTYPLLKPNDPIECTTMSGCNFSLRRSFVEEQDITFDEQLIKYAFKEDADVGHRIWQAGGIILLQPHMLLEHHASLAGRITPTQQLKMRYAYFFYLYFKNVSHSMFLFWWSLTGELLKQTLAKLLTLNFTELRNTYRAVGFALTRLRRIKALDLKEVNKAIFT